MVSAVEGWADYWQLVSNQYQLRLNTDVFYRLANCLKYCSPIQQLLIHELEHAVIEQKRVYLQIPEEVLRENVTTMQIKFELEKVGLHVNNQ